MIYQVSKILTFIALFLFITSFNIEKESASLKVNINGLVINKGMIHLALYSNEDDFMKKPLCIKRLHVCEITDGILIKDLYLGDYAVTLYQDINNNGELDKLFSIPLEPYGLSNNTNTYPSFNFQKFSLKKDTTINIQLKN